jgi:3-dehydroquinate synthase
MPNTLTVALGDRSYPIWIGPGLLAEPGLLQSAIRGRQALIVTNERVGPLYLEPCLRALGGLEVATVVLPDGEEYKTLTSMERIIAALLERRFDRRCTLVALGGGVVGDITGFAASVYQRGVDFVQVPTTLLAQVDSSVGGKTAVNHLLGKNMIGTFYQPRAVLADTSTLDTLDDRQLRAGLAEVVKYGFIRDPVFLLWLEENMAGLLARDPGATAHAIRRSCEIKAEVVVADEREDGVRAILNFGHTFGHAMETGLGYGTWLHGEAVAAGMVLAAELSGRLGWLGAADVARIRALLARAGLPLAPPAELSGARLQDLMRVDKKVRDGMIHLVLLKGLGQAVVTADYAPELLTASLDEACGCAVGCGDKHDEV